MKVYRNSTIEDLRDAKLISSRTYNALYSLEIETLGDVIDRVYYLSDLLRLPKIGPKSYKEITDAINKIDKRTQLEPRSEGEANMSVGEQVQGILEDAYLQMWPQTEKVEKYIRQEYPNGMSLHTQIIEKREPLRICQGLTMAENILVRKAFEKFTATVLDMLENKGIIQGALYRGYKTVHKYIHDNLKYFTPEESAKYLLTPKAKEYVERTYQKMCNEMLSVRARNYKDKCMPHVEDMLEYADLPLNRYSKASQAPNPPKTITEIFEFNQTFKKEFNKMMNMTEEEINKENLKFYYPFLKKQQVELVNKFCTQQGREPMLYLLYYYLICSDSRPERTFTMFFGLTDGKRKKHEDVAKEMNLTRERVRQITTGDLVIQNPNIKDPKKWEPYQELFNTPYFTEDSEEYKEIQESERLPEGYHIFARLIALMANYRNEEVNGHLITINKNVLPHADIKGMIHELMAKVNSIRPEDEIFNISEITRKVPGIERKEITKLLIYTANNILGIKTSADGGIMLHQNTIDIRQELYDILEAHGKPMHIKEIFEEFKKKYPDHKYKEPRQIRSFLYLSDHIKAIGKSSQYALDTWKGVYFGSIRHLIMEMLEKSDEPMHIDDILKEVTKYYPKTNRSSLLSTMIDEQKHRFLAFKKGYYGLTTKQYSDKYIKRKRI